jgi:accessory gene regulator protein AgrB
MAQISQKALFVFLRVLIVFLKALFISLLKEFVLLEVSFMLNREFYFQFEATSSLKLL